MFTGIVQGLCAVESARREAGGRLRLRVCLGALADGIALGASVAINGCCLTATAADAGGVEFDVIPETLANTNLGGLRAHDLVNVERSARLQDEVGGHRVSGHVSGIARVVSIAVNGDDYRVRFEVPPPLLPCLLHKGFVALDGASLTISAVDRRLAQIEVSLIPETLTRTLFGRRQAGGLVNLEIDPTTQAVVETVQRLLADPDLRAQLLSSAQ